MSAEAADPAQGGFGWSSLGRPAWSTEVGRRDYAAWDRYAALRAGLPVNAVYLITVILLLIVIEVFRVSTEAVYAVLPAVAVVGLLVLAALPAWTRSVEFGLHEMWFDSSGVVIRTPIGTTQVPWSVPMRIVETKRQVFVVLPKGLAAHVLPLRGFPDTATRTSFWLTAERHAEVRRRKSSTALDEVIDLPGPASRPDGEA